MWGNQSGHRGQIPLNLEAQPLKGARDYCSSSAALLKLEGSCGSPCHADANDEEAPTPSGDSTFPQQERNCPCLSKHMQACPLVRDRTLWVGPLGHLGRRGLFLGTWSWVGLASPYRSLGMICWHPSPSWQPMENPSLESAAPRNGRISFCFEFGLSTGLPHRFPACPLPTCQQLRGLLTTSGGT